MKAQIVLRTDNNGNWQSHNPTLASGEGGYEIDTKKYKIGDGVTSWSGLPYVGMPVITTLSGVVSNDSIASSAAVRNYISGLPAGSSSSSNGDKIFLSYLIPGSSTMV